jgi:hypothetical protein
VATLARVHLADHARHPGMVHAQGQNQLRLHRLAQRVQADGTDQIDTPRAPPLERGRGPRAQV